MSEVNFYKILGVAKDATKDQIKKAYYRVSKQVHPDIKGARYEDVFIQVNEAYQTLIDNNKRRLYDKYGYTGSSEVELQSEAYQQLRGLILDAISKQGDMIFHLNIIDVITNHCKDNIKSLQDGIDKCIQRKDHLNIVRSKFNLKRSIKEDMINNAFKEEMTSIDFQIWDKLAKIQMLERVNNVVQNYEFKFTKKEDSEEQR